MGAFGILVGGGGGGGQGGGGGAAAAAGAGGGGGAEFVLGGSDLFVSDVGETWSSSAKPATAPQKNVLNRI